MQDEAPDEPAGDADVKAKPEADTNGETVQGHTDLKPRIQRTLAPPPRAARAPKGDRPQKGVTNGGPGTSRPTRQLAKRNTAQQYLAHNPDALGLDSSCDDLRGSDVAEGARSARGCRCGVCDDSGSARAGAHTHDIRDGRCLPRTRYPGALPVWRAAPTVWRSSRSTPSRVRSATAWWRRTCRPRSPAALAGTSMSESTQQRERVPSCVPFELTGLNTGLVAAGTATNPTLAAAILANPENYYVNVHTTACPTGTIRGQLG